MSTGTLAVAMLALLPVVFLLKRRLNSGLPPEAPDTSWERLSAAYAAEDVNAKMLLEKIAAKVGLGYAGIGADAEGLLLWHPGHKGARIPWADITLVPGRYLDAPAFRVEAVRALDVSILMPRRLEEKLRLRAGDAWPGVADKGGKDAPAGGGAP